MQPKAKRKAEIMSEAKLSKADLRQFTGSEQWYQHGINRTVLFTTAQNTSVTKAALTGLVWLSCLSSAARDFGHHRVEHVRHRWRLAPRVDLVEGRGQTAN
jgi:hypothetical protein